MQDGFTDPFMWKPGGKMVDLGSYGNENGRAVAVNSANQIVINSDDPYRTYVYSGGHATQFSTGGAWGTVGTAINDHGVVVGYWLRAGFLNGQAMMWNGSTITDLGSVAPRGGIERSRRHHE